jgi:branched-chain amino acid transport system substrate-binding protein
LRKRPLALPATFLAILAAGCAGDEPDSDRARGDTLTVYSATPAHGVSAAAGRAAVAGARLALAEAGGRAGGRRLRMVALSSTRPGDAVWDPGTVETNAERAADDPSAIAYLGDLDLGASAVSLPVTNRAGLLQVSPMDGLTSLTRAPPGQPRAGPERYYPGRVRNFVRLVPNDLEVATTMVRMTRESGARRVVVLHTDGFAERELAGILTVRLRRVGRPAVLVERVDDDAGGAADLTRDVAEHSPQAILFAGVPGAAATALIESLSRSIPRIPVFGSAALGAGDRRAVAGRAALTGVLPAADQPARGRRLLRRLGRTALARSEALYGYDAMRMVLDAVRSGGADRSKVVRAALGAGVRTGATGRYVVTRRGDVTGRAVVLTGLDPAPDG